MRVYLITLIPIHATAIVTSWRHSDKPIVYCRDAGQHDPYSYVLQPTCIRPYLYRNHTARSGFQSRKVSPILATFELIGVVEPGFYGVAVEDAALELVYGLGRSASCSSTSIAGRRHWGSSRVGGEGDILVRQRFGL